MSASKRKVKKYVLKMVDNKSGNSLTGATLIEVFARAFSVPESSRVFDDPARNKFYILDRFERDSNIGTGYFTSAKYNHRPDLISKTDLQRRPNPKKLEEGESERTHLGLGSKAKAAILLLEAKGGGISLGPLMRYLAQYAPPGAHVEADLFAGADFVRKLQTMTKATAINVYADRNIVNPTFGTSRDMPEMQDNVVITFKAKRKESIKKYVHALYGKIAGNSEASVNRIRVHGKTEDNDDLIVDTERLTDSEFIGVELDGNGQVITESIVPKLKDMLRPLI
jgi:hypothetical protein